MNDLADAFHLQPDALGHLTSAVQLGFIAGTLIFAVLTLGDRYSPSKVFFFSALLGSLFNLGIVMEGNNLTSILLLRFLTGFFLAGIYPVGMKIAADYFDQRLGKSLGYLVGALVLGTAFPHLLKELTFTFPWETIILATSVLALLGGLLVIGFIPDGPFRKSRQRLELTAFYRVFRNRQFRSAAFGYFGHMWELYAFWTFVPIILTTYTHLHLDAEFNIPLWSFLIIAIGGPACVLGGYIAQSTGTKLTACIALLLSCICCLLSPFIFKVDLVPLFLGFLLFWGSVVIADSPLFSTLVAKHAAADIKGTALTIVNCIGFSITIISIQTLNLLIPLTTSNNIYAVLALGPILGLYALTRVRPIKE